MNASLVEFSTLLQKVKNLNKLSYICGDYNIDFLKIKINPRFGEFFDHIISSKFFSKITLPTIFIDQSATLIDNEIFITHFQLAKNKHLPKKSVRYQKRKHKKSKWLTTGILNSINTKDGLYETLL